LNYPWVILGGWVVYIRELFNYRFPMNEVNFFMKGEPDLTALIEKLSETQ